MKKVAVILMMLIAMAHAIGDRCGTYQAIMSQSNSGKALARSIYTKIDQPSCDADYYYGTVLSRKTEHFQIFYTLKGPHASTEEFIDSAATNLEKAWNLIVTKTGMKAPLAIDSTLHYKQPIAPGLYPIEVLELNMVRGIQNVMNNAYGCKNGCFGLTVPTSNGNTERTELLLDNDFFFIPQSNRTLDTVYAADGSVCTYPVATSPLVNETNYSVEWGKGIRVAVYHELYHAVQLRYLNLYQYKTFWFEASASGIEEIGAPDVNDYFAYLPAMFSITGTPLDQMSQDYGAGIFYIYLYNLFGIKFDKSIWESFAMSPSKDFETHLKAFTQKNGMAADSLFHDFASRLFFAGSRSSAVDSSFWIHDDQPKWPTFKTKEKPEYNELRTFAYDYYSMPELDAQNIAGKASAALFRNGKAEIRPIANTRSVDSILIKQTSYDSLSWIVSRFDETQKIPEEVVDSTLRVYPVPWRGGNLCFTPLPQNKNFIEIRNRRGALVMRANYDRATLCLDEQTVKNEMVPGVYRFRPGTSGKTKDFLIIY